MRKVGKMLTYQIIPEKIGSYRYNISEGELPKGLSLSDDGLIYGKLKNVGNYSFCIIAKSKCYKETFCFSLRVNKQKKEKKVKWVAVGGTRDEGKTSGSIYYSYDAINWDLAFTRDFKMFGVAYNGSKWVAVGSKSPDDFGIFYSNDGISWTPSNNGFSIRGNGIAWGLNKWVAVGEDSTSSIKYSYNGIDWFNALSNPFSGVGFGVAWNGSMWVAVGQQSSGTNTIRYSSDGINWNDATGSLFTGLGSGVAWNGEKWVAVGFNFDSISILHSDNGENWTVANNGFLFRGQGVASDGDKWVAVGATTPINILNSDNGEDWKDSNNGFSNFGNGVASDGKIWVAVGKDTSSRIKYSTNGFDWTNTIGGFPLNEDGNGVASSRVLPI